VRSVLPIGGATGGSGNLSTSLPNVASLAAHSKFVWVFNTNCDGIIIYNENNPENIAKIEILNEFKIETVVNSSQRN
jgi:hypothetical protein